jgi:hypothetical protein
LTQKKIFYIIAIPSRRLIESSLNYGNEVPIPTSSSSIQSSLSSIPSSSLIPLSSSIPLLKSPEFAQNKIVVHQVIQITENNINIILENEENVITSPEDEMSVSHSIQQQSQNLLSLTTLMEEPKFDLSYLAIKKDLEETKQNNSMLQEQVKFYKAANEKLLNLNANVSNNMKECEQKRMQLQLELGEYTKTMYQKKELISKVKELVSPLLSSNQIDLLTNHKKQVRWTREEISSAFSLRYLSLRSYKHLRKNMNFPLPSTATLQRYASKINLREGVLNDVINMMSLAGHDMTDRERAVVLMYDEMKCKNTYEYDKISDEIIGPYSNLQVIIARGLFSNWKQPIYIGFDQNITKELLNGMIVKLNDINYNVVACVSDLGGSNQGLWKQLGVDADKAEHFFKHPVTEEKICVFPDAPHLLKLIRNWLLDSGYINIFFSNLVI